jgi:hypothetical protein
MRAAKCCGVCIMLPCAHSHPSRNCVLQPRSTACAVSHGRPMRRRPWQLTGIDESGLATALTGSGSSPGLPPLPPGPEPFTRIGTGGVWAEGAEGVRGEGRRRSGSRLIGSCAAARMPRQQSHGPPSPSPQHEGRGTVATCRPHPGRCPGCGNRPSSGRSRSPRLHAITRPPITAARMASRQTCSASS